MHRRLRKKLQISVQPFMVKTELLFGTFRNSGAAVAMLLPHEMFADICTKMPALAAERICGAPGTAEDFWDLMKGESWMATHPLRERLLSSNPPTPLRTWGDDCALGKSGYTEARVMNWCSCVGTVLKLGLLQCFLRIGRDSRRGYPAVLKILTLGISLISHFS